MKTLGEFLEDLSFGPLAGLSIGSEGAGTIKEGKLQRIASLADGGLRRLHSRFILSEKSVVIRCTSGREVYPLLLEHSFTLGDPNVDRFILDTSEDPFKEDIIKIIKAFTPGEDGKEMITLPLNDAGKDDSVFTPTNREAQLPNAEVGDLYAFTYQAHHEDLDHENMDQEILIPDSLNMALETWVASKVFGSMNGAENRARSMELMSFYEISCNETVTGDLASTSLVTTTAKLESRGFV
jgi:hypothetical protein